MRTLEKILILLFVLTLGLQFFLIAGTTLLFVLVAMLLSCIYFYLGFAVLNGVRFRSIFKKAAYEEFKGKEIAFAIGIGLSLSTLVIGILFKALQWPGAEFMLQFGLGSGLILLLAVVLFFRKNNPVFFKFNTLRIGIFGLLGIIFYFISNNTFLEIKYGEYPEYVELRKQLYNDPTNLELQQQVNDAYFKIEQEH
ncbi:hypothetical protein SAMN05216474_0373 [Lishizhenia tianjinensis]|uniref:Uncharacterized protein n=1 Tax=Lishizhenia tianjinensis TaxID=477690 RepID=A0A1I6XPX9_9FLAO|nr:hypothetical protein [Lishizhenia tianjinensis]SFT40418.1 hypothetical protein SAMN05216474_0373 [Lishizhenia tianjinensis]